MMRGNMNVKKPYKHVCKTCYHKISHFVLQNLLFISVPMYPTQATCVMNVKAQCVPYVL